MYDPLQLNKANLLRFGFDPEEVVDIAHGGTGATTATGALSNLGIPVFSILNYGADPLGIADSTTAINDAFVAAAAVRGTVLVPYGTYKVAGVVTMQPNVEFRLEGATLTGLRSGGGYTFLAEGTVGTEIPLTFAAVRGDTILHITSTAGLSAGDYVFAKSTMRTLVAGGLDAPPEWQLGDVSSPSASPFFADPPIRILSVDSATQITLETPLIFPSYALSGSGSRSVSTVQKINWMEGVRVSGHGVIEGGGTTVFRFVWCMEPQFERGITFKMGSNAGASIRMENCYKHRVDAFPGTNHQGLPTLPAFLLDHSDFNSYLDVGCWFGWWNVADRNGSQGLDITWASGGHPSVQPYISGVSVDNAYDGMTFHQGAYGGLIDGFVAIRPANNGIRQRSRGVTIVGAQMIGPNQSGVGGIGTIGWGLVDAEIVGCTIDGFPLGIHHDANTGVSPYGPAVLNAKISNIDIIRASVSAILIQNRTVASAADSQLSISGITTDQIGSHGIDIGNYWNCVQISDIRAGSFTGASGFAVYLGSNSVGARVSRIAGALESTTGLVRTGNITDTGTFPVGLYPTNANKIDIASLKVTGAGFMTATTTGTFRIFNASFTLNLADGFTTCRASGSGGYTITVPTVSVVPFAVNSTQIDVINGSSGTVTIAGAGITFNAPSGLVLTPGQRGTLYQGAANTWWFWKVGSGNDLTIWDFGADGLGGATDLAALDAMLAALVAGLPKLPDWAEGPINVGLLIPGPPGTDPMPYLQKIYAAFDTALLWAATFDYTSVRDWVFPARPTTGLGPQSQYLTPPLKSTHRWMGAVWDASAWRESTTRTISNITAANPCVVTYTGNNPVDGDWIRIGGPPGSSDAVGGMTQINNRGFLVYLLDTGAKTFQLKDPVSKAVISSAAYTPYTSGGTWNVISSPTVFRREGAYGTPLTVSGTLAKWATSIAVTSGGTTIKPGDRFLLCNTTALTTLVGAFTLVDAIGTQSAARSETIIAAGPAVGGVIPIENALRDTYDTSATPLLYPILNEPEIQLVNPAIKGPSLLNDTRMFLFALCRNARIDGGNISQIGGNIAAVYGSLGGHIKDMTLTSTRQPGLAGGGIVYGADTTGFEISGNRSFGNSQVIMASGTGSFYGITRDVTVRENYIYNPATGISTHNLHECLNFIDNEIWLPAVGIDIRCPLCIVRGNLVDGATAQVMLLRISPNGLIVDGLVGRNSLTGIYLEDSNSPEYDYDPANFTLRNLVLENIGGSESKGAISFSYGQLRSGVRPVLGELLIENAYVSMNNDKIAISVGGKWTTPKVSAVIEAAPGTSPSNQSVFFSSAGGIAGQGPSDTFLSVKQSSTYQTPLTQHTTGRITESTAIEGLTSTRVITLTTATTLVAPQASSAVSSGEFNNSGAVALVQVTLPSATGASPQMFRFDVTSAQGFKIIAGAGDTIQIGAGAPGAAAGSITSAAAPAAPIGSWVTVRSITSVKWVASVNDPADWTVA